MDREPRAGTGDASRRATASGRAPAVSTVDGPPVGPDDGPVITARRRATQDRLIEAARRVFASRGVDSASVEDICEEAGFTRGAFYSNFADKHALVAALVASEARALRGRLDEALAHSPRDLAETVQMVFAVRPFSSDFYVVHTDLVLHLVRRRREGTAGDDAGLAPVHAVLVELVSSCLDTLGLRATVPESDLVRVLTGVLEQSHRAAIEAGDDDLDALARRVMPSIVETLTEPIAT